MEHELAITSHAAERYVLGQMDEPERDAYELHYFECPACTADVENATHFMDNGRAAIEAPGRVVSIGRWNRLRADPWFGIPVAATLVLGALTAYQTAFRIPALERELARASQPQSFLAFAVKGAVRGGESVIALPVAPTAFAITVDLPPEMNSARYRCTLAPAAGGPVATILSEAPPAGSPLSILIPAGALTAGTYRLQVTGEDRGTTNGPSAVFTFVLQKGSPSP